MNKYAAIALALANLQGGPAGRLWALGDILDYEGVSDGCSGGLSWAYGLGGKNISCHQACVLHDFLYMVGGGFEARYLADVLLMLAAAAAGKPVPGWLVAMRVASPHRAALFAWLPPLRRAWRWLRSRLMFLAVRMFGWLYFAKQ